MQKWIIDDRWFDDPREAADFIAEHIDEETYDDMLDECYEPVVICGMVYSPSIALYRVDPIAYQVYRSEWEDSVARDIVSELEKMSDGDVDWFCGEDVECIYDEEDE